MEDIIVASDSTILSGHCRLAALQALGELETTVWQYPVLGDSLEARAMWVDIHLGKWKPTLDDRSPWERFKANMARRGVDVDVCRAEM